MSNSGNKGPLSGLTIIEMVGIGPGPFAGMLLADMGARVIQIEKGAPYLPIDIKRRGKESIKLNLKVPEGVDLLKKLVAKADGIFEGFRPGVMEKLGLGPDVLQAINPALVYGRMTGWGQDGPIAHTAGHDINYIARAGVLGSLGTADQPPQHPLNLVGDYGGGALFLVIGMLAALIEAKSTGKGRVVDAAMVDGSALLMSLFAGMQASGLWDGSRGTNTLSGGAPFYGVYETSDGQYMAAGPIEPQFAMVFYEKLGLPELIERHLSMPDWPDMKEQIAGVFKTKTRDQWATIFEGTEGCVTPVLSYREAADDVHIAARGIYREKDGAVQAAPAPRFSGIDPTINPIAPQGSSAPAILGELGYSDKEIEALQTSRVI